VSCVSASEAGLVGLFAWSVGWVFWVSVRCLVLVLEDGGQHLIFCVGIFASYFLGFLVTIVKTFKDCVYSYLLRGVGSLFKFLELSSDVWS
jgi:hypothetical protein